MYHGILRSLIVVVTALALAAGCGTKPEPYHPHYDGVGGDWTKPDGWVAPDGWVPPDGWIPPDGWVPGDGWVPPEDGFVPPDDAIPGLDLEPGPDETAPKVLSAFSPDGAKVVVRFDEIVDADSAQAAGAFSITGSDMSQVDVSGVEIFKQFAHLTLGNPGQVNPDFTYTVLVKHVEDAAGNVVDAQHNKATIKRSVYLSIVWHQHQPLYLDPVKDELSGPWVRKHATKDYYDMAAIIRDYPAIHMNINLTIVLLNQLLTYYVDRLGPFVDVENNTIDEAAFLAAWEGHTDPWIDLLLKDTPTPEEATEKELGLLYADPWACVSTSDALMKHFPQYVEIREKNPALLTHEDFLRLKILFEIAWMDPDFLDGPVTMTNGMTVDLTDLLDKSMGTDAAGWPIEIYMVKEFSEEVANRLVAEQYKVMANVVPVHQELMYNPDTQEGQIEIMTTPFYHPILPLVYNSDLAYQGQPWDTLPQPPFAYEMDAYAHVLRATAYYEDVFGIPPRGMWCGEGSVAEDIVHILVDAGIKWSATGQQVLEASTLVGGGNHSPYYPYKVDSDTAEGSGGSTDDELVFVFRDPELSDRMGFAYQGLTGEAATADFFNYVLDRAPKFGGGDRLITVILDGENAWESYTKEMDGKGFFHAFYGALTESDAIGEIVPVTMSEYMDGNPDRGIPPHPTGEYKELEPLHAGSWIDGTFSVWIGEGEENRAWEFLSQTRKDLELSGLPQPNPSAPEPADTSSVDWFIWKAYDEVYAAEGSDWFWWYGADMTTPANDDTPFDRGFRSHLTGMYSFMNLALENMGQPTFPVPDFAPIIQKKSKPLSGPFETPPIIDGVFVPDETEWDEEGAYFFDGDSGGAMAGPNDDLAVIYYGYMDEDFYLGLQFNEDLTAKQGSNYNVATYFSHKHITNLDLGESVSNPANTTSSHGEPLNFKGGGAAWELKVTFEGGSPVLHWSAATGSGGWTAQSTAGIVFGAPGGNGKLLEFKIPYSVMEIEDGDPLELYVIAAEGDTVIDTAPYGETKVVFDDLTTMIYVTFECDATGTLLPLTTYTALGTLPPPGGNGIVYIAGEQDVLENWNPNKLPLVDNGEAPDEVAGDGKWTATFGIAPGTLLKYKYTIGLPKDEGNWSGTEEFPLTERGLEITVNPTIKKIKIHDVFADRPNPSGTMGPNSVVEELTE